MSICDRVRRWFCGAPEDAIYMPPPPPAPVEPKVLAMSPARLLAASMTDPETRGEWRRDYDRGGPYSVLYAHYRNADRDLSVTRFHGLVGTSITTPFKLTAAEERIVADALDRFDKREREIAEARTLARLIAPAGETRSAETAKSVSARSVRTQSRKGGVKKS